MKLTAFGRIILAAFFGGAAVWHYCILPLRYEVTLRRLEATTLRAVALPGIQSRILARGTLDTIRNYKDPFSHDVRLAMIEGANERISGRPAAAVGAYERALRYDRRPEIYLNLALAQQQLGNGDDASHSLAKAIRFSPEMASDVADVSLKREAIAIIRGGHAKPPICCAANYSGGKVVEMLEQFDGVLIARPSGIRIPLTRGSSAQFAWNGSGAVNLIVRIDATGSAERLRLAHDGRTLSRQPLPAIGEEWHFAGIGEFTVPGKVSLLLSNIVTSDVKLWTFDAAENVTETLVPSLTEENAYIAMCADFDHDGHVDALYRSFAGEDFLWLLDGTTRKAKVALPASGFQRDLVAAADFTQDSQPDLLWYDFETRRSVLWVMHGTFIESVQYWPRR